jgi:hypothetical protein
MFSELVFLDCMPWYFSHQTSAWISVARWYVYIFKTFAFRFLIRKYKEIFAGPPLTLKKAEATCPWLIYLSCRRIISVLSWIKPNLRGAIFHTSVCHQTDSHCLGSQMLFDFIFFIFYQNDLELTWILIFTRNVPHKHSNVCITEIRSNRNCCKIMKKIVTAPASLRLFGQFVAWAALDRQ